MGHEMHNTENQYFQKDNTAWPQELLRSEMNNR